MKHSKNSAAEKDIKLLQSRIEKEIGIYSHESSAAEMLPYYTKNIVLKEMREFFRAKGFSMVGPDQGRFSKITGKKVNITDLDELKSIDEDIKAQMLKVGIKEEDIKNIEEAATKLCEVIENGAEELKKDYSEKERKAKMKEFSVDVAKYSIYLTGFLLCITAGMLIAPLISPAAGIAALAGLSTIQVAGLGGGAFVSGYAVMITALFQNAKFENFKSNIRSEIKNEGIQPSTINKFSNMVYEEYKAVDNLITAAKDVSQEKSMAR